MIKPNKNWILKDSDALLRQKCKSITLPLTKQQSELVNKMVTYVDASYENKIKEYDIRPGIGLAGPQVGLMYCVIYIHGDFDNKEHKYLFANPKIIGESKTSCFIGSGEGCLSVDKDVKGIVKRKNKITVKAIDLFNNKEVKITISGLLAICFQHEMDHLDGILYYDRINRANPFFKEEDWIQY